MTNFLTRARQGLVNIFQTDPNINRVRGWIGPVSRRLPSATAEYLAEKLPIAQWLPHYNYRWVVQDAIAGITVGVMLIPQGKPVPNSFCIYLYTGLAYAKIANIDIVNGLYSSFFPPALYFFLGTSKELSVGPTSILGLLTAECVQELTKEGYKSTEIASAMAFLVGIFSLAIGLLKLGFLLDFVSAPVLTGWISAVAIVIALGQMGSLVGLDAPSDTAGIIRAILGHLGSIKPLTLCIGLTGIAVLVAFEQVGKRWGKRSKYIKFAVTSRAVIVLVLFTLISYLCNRGRPKDLLWAITKVEADGLPTPRGHDSNLLKKVLAKSIAPLIAMAVEHLGVGKAFGLRNNYSIDKSQELVYLGANNMINSLFGAMPTGGAMSRTAVNSDCNVRSPANFIFTSGFIILTLYKLAPALYWIPKATLSAIIIMAVAHLVAHPRQIWRFWKMSFIDFVGSMLGFWVTLFTSTEIGLATAVGFSIVYTLLRLAFPRLVGLSHIETRDMHLAGRHATSSSSASTFAASSPSLPPPPPSPHHHHHQLSPQPFRGFSSSAVLSLADIDVPADAFLVQYTDDILFPNAGRLKLSVIQAVKVHFEPAADAVIDVNDANRTWNPSTKKQIARIRRRKGITALKGEDCPLRRVILDFTRVSFVDTTGIFSLVELKMELRRYVGPELQFRLVGLGDAVRERFDRSDWTLAAPGQQQRPQSADVVYSSLQLALYHDGRDDKEDAAVQEKQSTSIIS
ncbi:sulfate permease [Moelleriella libera RCEF 2490]|uniref:Sulfate permease n=1 Tax=Moelleriella libera RCEF 2490 TaxID=1081109 RepID=A0A166U2G2_9HYPO|nr:sulfate permease [Moelleriella libera RCEF 2490]